MEATLPAYHISSLGDSAILINFGNRIDEEINKRILAITAQLRNGLADVIEIVPAYSSLSIYFDVVQWRKKTPKEKLVFDHVKELTQQLLSQPFSNENSDERRIRIPVCYDPEFAGDISSVAAFNNISVDEVVSRHLSRSYRVYMLGFLPGFCYLGETDRAIAMPRKKQPAPVEPGSVGIAGKQTGIYPLASPGGWHIIGRTPLKLFNDASEDPALFRAGDLVELFSISTKDFHEIKNSTSPFSVMMD